MGKLSGVYCKMKETYSYLLVGTLEHFSQPPGPELGLLGREHSPGVRGGGRLHDGLAEQVPRAGRQQVEGRAGRSGRF